MRISAAPKMIPFEDFEFSGGISVQISGKCELIVRAELDESSDPVRSLSLLFLKENHEIVDEFHFSACAEAKDSPLENAIQKLGALCAKEVRRGDVYARGFKILDDLAEAIRSGSVNRIGVKTEAPLGVDMRSAIFLGMSVLAWEAIQLASRAFGMKNPIIDHTGDVMNGYVNSLLCGLTLTAISPRKIIGIPETASLFSVGTVLVAELAQLQPRILGTPDPKDIPAGVLGAFVGFLLLKNLERSQACAEHSKAFLKYFTEGLE